MELPNVGHQCSQLDCKQLDFLPLQCKCGKQFCSEHFNKHIQTCEVYSRIETEPKKIENIYKCTRDGCNETSLVPLICNKCQQHFCVKHRHITQCHDIDEETIAKEKEKYAAPLRQFSEAKGAVDKQIENSIKEAKLKGKNASLANKLQLMKIKNKATGLKTIPLGERVYFNIFQVNSRVTPVFVSKKWSVGRAIDAIADECKLQNDNNKSKGRKLRLFKKDTGVLISNNVADILEFLINGGAIIDGENLLINYINDA